MTVSRIRAAVLMGGTSAEREVSLSSGREVLEAMDPEVYDAVVVDPGKPGWAERLLALPRPEVAVICLHGPGGEDGAIQGFLQTLGIPFTGSGILSSALCMDKEAAKLVLQANGLPVPHSFTVTPVDRDRSNFRDVLAAMPLPLIVKPNRQGSTRGTAKVTEASQLLPAIDDALQYDTRVLLEEYAEGTEITAAVLGGEELEVLPLIEIIPQSGFYDYHDKYTPGATEEIVPARIPEQRAEQARQYALRAHQCLKCWGISRTDMIVGERQTWILETNTIPGMTPTSLVPRAAGAIGQSLGDLVRRLIELARTRPEG